MHLFPVAIAFLLHVMLWGAGASRLCLPRAARAAWPLLAFPFGAALQTLVVWTAAELGLPGADRYAWWSEALPLLLGLAALRPALRGSRGPWAELVSARALAGCTVLVLGLLLIPFLLAGGGLASFSLGSCDPADYAAGARVLREFSRGDRMGLMGLPEVTSFLSVPNFYDLWLRIEHFSPAALIAFNGVILGCAPFQLTSLTGAVLLAGTLPAVALLGRSVLRHRPGAALWVAVLYGLNPICWYAVFNGALAQLEAALGIGVVTWAAVSAWRHARTARAPLAWFGALLAGFVLVLGAYNFAILLCLLPAAALVGASTLWEPDGRRLLRWMGAIVPPLLLAGALLGDRVVGIADRIRDIRDFRLGWDIPALGPEGWLGLVSGPGLERLARPLADLLAVLVVAGWIGSMVGARGRPRAARRLIGVLAMTVPVTAGYAWLLLHGSAGGTNNRYNAYKLLALFLPSLLPALLAWASGPGGRGAAVSGTARVSRFTVAGLLTVAVLGQACAFARAAARTPLRVDRELVSLGALEQRPGIHSVNMRIDGTWERLWASAFLLRLPQFFSVYTYEGHRNTPLRGEWDLTGGLLQVSLPGGDSLRLSPHYALSRSSSRYFLRASMEAGWYPEESLPHTSLRWRWSGGRAALRVDNPQARPLRVRVSLRARAQTPRRLGLSAGSACAGEVDVGSASGTLVFPRDIWVPAGVSELLLRSDRPAVPAADAPDSRPLDFCAEAVDLAVQEDLPAG